MKTLSILAALSAALPAAAVPAAAQAQAYRSINQRQDAQLRRIDQGVRTGALTRREADRLRSQFTVLDRLERRYRASNGLSRAERADLDARFDALSRRIRTQRNDRQYR